MKKTLCVLVNLYVVSVREILETGHGDHKHMFQLIRKFLKIFF
jgi:hypothetical protein